MIVGGFQYFFEIPRLDIRSEDSNSVDTCCTTKKRCRLTFNATHMLVLSMFSHPFINSVATRVHWRYILKP